MLKEHPILRVLLFALPLIFLCSLLFSPLMKVGFYDEDDWYHLVFGKKVIEQGFFKADIPKMLIEAPQFTSEHVRAIFVLQYWWAITYKAFGTGSIGHHLLAFFLILLCGAFGFGIVTLMTGRKKSAFVAACLFILFPLNPCLVAHGAAIVYPLLTFFFMASIFFYIAFLKGNTKRSVMSLRQIVLYLCSFVFCVLAVLTQESAYGLPVLILFLDLIVVNSDDKGQFIGSVKHTKILKPVLRSAPFLLVVVSVIEFTASMAYEHLASENLESHYFDFIGLPFLKFFTIIPEAFITPFYVGYGRGVVIVIAAATAGLVALIVLASSLKSQNKPALLFAICWIVIASLPILQVLDRVIFPDETEEKYLFLPMFGFMMLLSLVVYPKVMENKIRKIMGIGSLAALVVFYVFGFWSNAGFFVEKGQQYNAVQGSLNKVAQEYKAAKTVALIYHKNQQYREMQLAAFLEYTFDRNEKRRWFFIDRAEFIPIVNGVLPEQSTPNIEKNFEKFFSPKGNRKSKFKFPSFFNAITLQLDHELAVLGVDPETGEMVDVKKLFLHAAATLNPPKSVKLEQFIKDRYKVSDKEASIEGALDFWIIKGFVYQIYPGIGRF